MHTHIDTYTVVDSLWTEEPGDLPQALVGKGFSMWLNCSQPPLLSVISVRYHVTSCGGSFIRDDDWLWDETRG